MLLQAAGEKNIENLTSRGLAEQFHFEMPQDIELFLKWINGPNTHIERLVGAIAIEENYQPGGLWYGKEFDVELDYARFRLRREYSGVRLFMLPRKIYLLRVELGPPLFPRIRKLFSLIHK